MVKTVTESVCPVCLRKVPAQKVVREDGCVYLEKTCPEHGTFSVMIWEDDWESYLSWDKENKVTEAPVEPKAAEKGCPYDCGLCTEHVRKGCCMLLELTNRCNLHCPVCFASAGDAEPKDLTLEEIEAQYDYLMAHGGPFNIQLSGGEPTVRKDLPQIIRMGRQKGFTFFQLNTNGVRLAAEPAYARELKAAGLNTVFLQFDGLDDGVYTVLRGRPLLEEKRRAIRHCAAAGLGVVLVPVIAQGVNENQIGPILQFAVEQMPAVRGVHFQPLSHFGRCSLEAQTRRITIPWMLRAIETQTGGLMKREDFGGGNAENPYCSFHASFMRKADGSLKALAKRSQSCCCTGSDDSREFVANQWTGVETTCCGAEEATKPEERNCCCEEEPKKAVRIGAAARKEFRRARRQQLHSADVALPMTETSSLDEFLAQARANTLAISGMLFQDAYTLDLDRLRRCYICEVDKEQGMVPFCAYNLTGIDGKALYRR